MCINRRRKAQECSLSLRNNECKIMLQPAGKPSLKADNIDGMESGGGATVCHCMELLQRSVVLLSILSFVFVLG